MLLKTWNGKIIGKLDTSSRLFVKNVTGSKHMLREPKAWAIDKDVVNTLGLVGCDSILIKDKEGGRYVITYKDFVANAFQFDRGYGEQLAVVLDKWNKLEAHMEEK